MNDFNASRAVLLILKTGMVVEQRKFSKIPNWRRYLLKTRLKRKQNWQNQRHDKVILQHDNCRPHVARPVKTYLETLKWNVVPHPPDSPDVAPSDYHLFRSITHGLTYQHFRFYGKVKKRIDSWIASKYASFFRDGIQKLLERWKNVVASKRQYFESY